MRPPNPASFWNLARRCLLPLGLAAALPGQEHDRRLHGVVLDSHSRPVVNAAVTIDHGGATPRRTFTDATGQFRSARLPASRLVVRAVAETAAGPLVGAAFVNHAVTNPRHVTIRTRPARRVAGIVRGAEGEPIAGAWVSATPFGFAACSPLARSTTTDPNGRFELTHVPCGRLELRAWDANHRGTNVTLPPASEPLTRTDLTMAAGGPVVHTVTALDATPRELESARLDVRITAAMTRQPLPPGLVRRDPTDPAKWTIRGWPIADELRLAMFADEVTFEPAEVRIRALCGDRTKRFHALVDEYRHIRGELVTDHELELGGRRLVARAARRGEVVETTGITERDGSFELRSPTPTGEQFTLQCLDDDLVLVDPDPRRSLRGLRHRSQVVLQHGRRRFHEVTAAPTTRVAGTVVTPDGAPYAYAPVAVLLLDSARMIRRLPRWSTLTTDGGAVTLADERGRFEFAHLDLSQREDFRLLVAGAQGHADRTVPVGDRRVIDLGSTTTSRGTTLTAIVTTADGEPIPGNPVQIMASATLRPIHVATDRAGKFTLTNLPPGPCTVVLIDPDGQPQSREVPLGGGPDEPTEVELTNSR